MVGKIFFSFSIIHGKIMRTRRKNSFGISIGTISGWFFFLTLAVGIPLAVVYGKPALQKLMARFSAAGASGGIQGLEPSAPLSITSDQLFRTACKSLIGDQVSQGSLPSPGLVRAKP